MNSKINNKKNIFISQIEIITKYFIFHAISTKKFNIYKVQKQKKNKKILLSFSTNF